MHSHDASSLPGGWAVPALVVVVPVLCYLAAVAARRIRLGRPWSPLRTAALVAGAAAAGVAVSPPVLAYAHADPRGHVLQHLLLGMYAPIAVVLSAPGTLALGAAGRWGRRLLAGLLRARVVRVATHPVPAAALHVGTLFVLHLTPLYRATLDSAPLHGLVAAHFFLTGWLYAQALVGPDPAPRRPGVALRAAVLVASAALHAFLAKLLFARAGELPPGAGAPVESAEQAARWMYYGGDLAELVLAVLLFAEWYRRRARADARATALRRPVVI